MQYLLMILLLSFSANAEELIVKLKPNTMHLFSTDTKILRTFDHDSNLVKMEGNLEELQNHPAVEYVEPNLKYHAFKVEEDGIHPDAWGVTKIKADQVVKQKGINGKDIKVAVIDTGVEYTHPALIGKILINEKEIPNNKIDDDKNGFIDDYYGWDFANGDNDPIDDQSHGTHCSGTIGGKNIGVAPGIKILPVKFLDKRGSGTLEGAIDSINYARLRGVDIMSNSWGGGGYSKALGEAIKEAEKAGIFFVAAAGNSSRDNDKRPTYPASYKMDNVIAVASMRKDDRMSVFSNYGVKTVHVAAPGSGIYSSVLKGKYAKYSGTSMAAPHISGLIALLLQVDNQLTYAELKAALIETSDSIEGLKVVAEGRVNALKAVESVE